MKSTVNIHEKIRANVILAQWVGVRDCAAKHIMISYALRIKGVFK